MVSYILICNIVLLTGCMGSAPNPIPRHMPGDENKSCSAISTEMNSIDGEIAIRKKSKKDRDVINVLLFIGGILIIVPFFFMDLKLSQEAEIRAYNERKANLRNIAAEKDCGPVGSDSDS